MNRIILIATLVFLLLALLRAFIDSASTTAPLLSRDMIFSARLLSAPIPYYAISV